MGMLGWGGGPVGWQAEWGGHCSTGLPGGRAVKGRDKLLVRADRGGQAWEVGLTTGSMSRGGSLAVAEAGRVLACVASDQEAAVGLICVWGSLRYSI